MRPLTILRAPHPYPARTHLPIDDVRHRLPCPIPDGVHGLAQSPPSLGRVPAWPRRRVDSPRRARNLPPPRRVKHRRRGMHCLGPQSAVPTDDHPALLVAGLPRGSRPRRKLGAVLRVQSVVAHGRLRSTHVVLGCFVLRGHASTVRRSPPFCERGASGSGARSFLGPMRLIK